MEKPLATNEDGPAQLLPYLVEALEEVVSSIGPMVEEEARVLFSAALTCVFSHLYLHDPAACLDELLEPVADEHCAAATAAMKGQVEDLLEKFDAFAPAPSTGGAGECDATQEGVPLAGANGIEG